MVRMVQRRCVLHVEDHRRGSLVARRQGSCWFVNVHSTINFLSGSAERQNLILSLLWKLLKSVLPSRREGRIPNLNNPLSCLTTRRDFPVEAVDILSPSPLLGIFNTHQVQSSEPTHLVTQSVSSALQRPNLEMAAYLKSVTDQ